MTKADKHALICKELNNLYIRKNHDYGDAFSESFKKYGNVMPLIRLEDKLNRARVLMLGESTEVKGESIRDTLIDLANYAIMTIIEMEGEAEA